MSYRDNGAIGALLDEYHKSIMELVEVCQDVTTLELTTTVDTETTDPDCKSIQTILSHVIRSGYTYSVEIYNHLGNEKDYFPIVLLDTVDAYLKELAIMFNYAETLFLQLTNAQIEENDPALKIKVRWGQSYDIEQLMEHAIVHILRHRRQIQRFIVKLRKEY